MSSRPDSPMYPPRNWWSSMRATYLPLHQNEDGSLPPKQHSREGWFQYLRQPRIVILAAVALFLFGFIAVGWQRRPVTDVWEKQPPTGVGVGHWDDDIAASGPRPPVNATRWAKQAEQVREAYLHAYHAYEATAFGKDELRPLSNSTADNFNGWGVSIVDSLDTMMLMGLKPEYERAVAFVANLNFNARKQSVHFFETVIRYLGGLLSAYHVSGEPIFLTKAEELGRSLVSVFDSPSGLPHYAASMGPGDHQPSGGRYSMYLAEIGSCQLEFKDLARQTGRAEYYTKAERVMQLMRENQNQQGLWATDWSIDSGKPTSGTYSIGALADSAFEYLLKQYLLSGRTEPKLLQMYVSSMRGVINSMLYVSPKRHLLYVTPLSGSRPTGRLEHLECFLPGLLALGAHSLSPDELPPRDAELHRWAAHGLAHTCALMYEEHPFGVGPEDVTFDPRDDLLWVKQVQDWEAAGRKGTGPPGVGDASPPVDKNAGNDQRDYHSQSQNYLLRPETIESVYYMWITTRDETWRARGATMWAGFLSSCRIDNGFASVSNLNMPQLGHTDSMPSYFLAETLKYYYMLFSDHEQWPIDKYVFNTEAHPLPIFQWRSWEKIAFGLE